MPVCICRHAAEPEHPEDVKADRFPCRVEGCGCPDYEPWLVGMDPMPEEVA